MPRAFVLVVLAGWLLVFYCACPPATPPASPDAATDAAPLVVDVAPVPAASDAVAMADVAPPAPSPGCKAWCDNAVAMHCPAGDPTPAGAPCTDVCQNLVDAGLRIDLGCRAFATTCAAADQCENVTDTSCQYCKYDGARAGIAFKLAEGTKSPSTCAAWCMNARALKCPAGNPTQHGSTCEDVCKSVMLGPKKFNLKCRSTAKSCERADACD